ncbi:MAG: Crp/Fnr family transcriptional regulator [Thiogranum sp.]
MIVTAEDFRARFPVLTAHASAQEVAALIDAMALREVPAGEVLVRDGEPADTLYFLWEGRMVAFVEAENVSIELGHVEPGETIGEVAVLDPGPATATVKAEVDSRVLALSPEGLRKLVRTHPSMCNKLVRMLTQLLVERLGAADELLLRHRKESEEVAGETAAHHLRDWPIKVYRKLFGHPEATA